ncbi:MULTISPECIES: NAD(P)/FAD-dependent oxidoreductase [unclassified Nocardia]|uniref:dihydrolipoyl dehydrogenase family protein n=1 Tax=unclassified Nocardia TaxID=2637762 RepID=UPI00278BED41|nr:MULTISPECIES: NAD(P)/FAD-dependent oxidoreductase [unclassified Nocardia]
MDYDVMVLGGGAAGLTAAEAAVRAGVRVVLVSEGELGGDCTFTGCVPSKTLIESAAQGLSYPQALERVHRTIERIAATENAEVLRERGIEVIRGRARFRSADTVEVDGRRLRAARTVIATGTVPAVPSIPGITDVPFLTTDTVFDHTDQPESMAIIGGGAVGCELAQALSRLGVVVHLIETAARLLPGVDSDAAASIAKILTEDGVSVHTATEVTSVTEDRTGIILSTDTGTSITVERLLMATGRTPQTAGLDLDNAGVRTDDQGFVAVDRHLATTTATVYAAGDVTGLSPFTHAAAAMGRTAVAAALRRHRRPVFDPLGIPRVVFTDPEVATVGFGEHEVGERARVAVLAMSELDRAITAERTIGFVKLIAGPRRILGMVGGGRILGATIVAARAGELIHEPALAMRTGMFTGRLAQTVHAYPTWSMAVQQAAAQFFGYGDSPRRPRRDGRDRSLSAR